MVVTVIGVMLALLFTVYSSVTRAAAQVECTNRLRHIYGATLAYVEDWDGLMYPDLGPRTDVHPNYNLNQYWFNQAYLGRYVLNDMKRRRDSGGAMTQEETEPFNCPLRFVDGTDLEFTQSNGNPGTSYLMRRQTPATSTTNPAYRIDFQFHNIYEPSRQVMITEGRNRIAPASGAQTGVGRDSTNRLRRYHKGGLNVLFYDGRIDLFTGGDDVLKREYWRPLRQ